MPRKKITKIHKYSRGFVTLLFLLVVVILAVLLTGGVFKNTPEPPTGQTEYTIDESSLPSGNSKDSLQLATFKFKACEEAAAVDFLVDNSGSMQGSKINDLKDGVNTFGANFSEQGVLGLQVYSSPQFMQPFGFRELVPIQLFAAVKPNFPNVVNSMTAGGSTHSKSAMEFAKAKLAAAIPQFPTYKFNLIFISDGIPENEDPDVVRQIAQTSPELCSINGLQTRCFAQDQNPETVASEIKAMGVRIFTIGYTDDRDAKFDTLLQNLMRTVASSPEDYYKAPVSSQVTAILAQISQKICQ